MFSCVCIILRQENAKAQKPLCLYQTGLEPSYLHHTGLGGQIYCYVPKVFTFLP